MKGSQTVVPELRGPVFIGIDGGATGTRLRLAAADGTVLGEGKAGPSSLTLPLADSLAAVTIALDGALKVAGLGRDILGQAIAVFGLAGARNPERRTAFLARLPAMRDVAVVGDGYAALIGAHAGRPGLVIAIGTGTVAHVLRPDGSSDQIGGWGFPIGDEGSGAWLGWRALAEAIHVRDGRLTDPPGGTALHRELLELCGGSDAAILAWLQDARSTKYAGLAPIVLRHAAAGDPAARAHLAAAADAIVALARAADPGATLPLCLTGGLAAPLLPYLPETLAGRARPPRGSAVDGALLIARDRTPAERLEA